MPPRLTSLPVLAAAPLATMHAACFPEDPWDEAAFERILALAGGFGYLAWQGDVPAGFILARDLGDDAEILTLGVLPEWRRRGLGRALLAASAAEAARRGLAAIVLEVAADNEVAQHLYAGRGFIQVGRRPRYYRRANAVVDGLTLRCGINGVTY